jgi:hypothetical protein
MIQGLSILIPTFADNPETLIDSLIKNKCDFQFEVLIQIDGTDHETIHYNWRNKYNSNPLVKIIQSPINKGRSITRNELATHARYSHLLFLDADTLPKTPLYLSSYSSYLTNQIVCGGNAYRFQWNRLFNLRYRYGKYAEETSASQRKLKPYQSFSSNNFIIPKNTFDQIQFDSSIKNYGHEDTLFGLQCKKLSISILHIDNAVYHEGLESNKIFVSKSETALKTLYELYASDKIKSTRLIETIKKVQSKFLLNGSIKCIVPFINILKFILINIYPSVILFNFYKLIFYYQLENEHRNI